MQMLYWVESIGFLGFDGRLLLGTFGTLAAVPVVDDLGEDHAVDRRGDDIRGNDDGVARLLDGREDAGGGTGEQQEHSDGRQLARASLTVVGPRLDQLHSHTHTQKRKVKIHNLSSTFTNKGS